MTKGIADTLGMKSLEEILAETETDVEEAVDYAIETIDDSQLPAPVKGGEPLMTTQQMKGLDHSKAMDELYDEALDVARKIVDMGMNIDPARAAYP